MEGMSMSGEICADNRFEIIAAYKKKLIEETNIQESPEEIAVIDNILFRFWQMGWLPPIPHGRLIDADALAAYDNDDFNNSVAKDDNTVQWIHLFIQDRLANAPTIIPAEEEQT